MNEPSKLYISGCKDHPGTTDLSCCRIRREDGTPLDIREVWSVIQLLLATRAELDEQRRELLEAGKYFHGAVVRMANGAKPDMSSETYMMHREAIARAEAPHE